jgi:amino acid adenylation domain-containing protein
MDTGRPDADPMAARCIHELFAEQAARTPAATALVHGPRRISYQELNARADRLAATLAAAGVGRGDLVGTYLPRSPDLVVALLATLKTGAGSVILDPANPADWLRGMARDAAVAAVLAAAGSPVEWLGSATPLIRVGAEPPAAAPLRSTAGPEDIACVMFTSGSTGHPKGIAVPHRAIVDSLAGQDYLPFTPSTVWLQCAAVSWDAFALELWGALLSGGTCVLYPGQRPDPARMASLVAEHGVSVMYLSGSLFNVVVDDYPGVLAGLDRLVVGGEVVSPKHVRLARERFPGLRLSNAYGPVETMIFTTLHPVTTADTDPGPVPIGRPLPGKTVHVLDERLRPVPAGTVGEAYAGGVGLAHGYLRRPGFTAERFVADPLGPPGARLYRTGDLARRDTDGVLHFVARADAQVKIRGNRVEPAQVQAVLARHPGVARVAVLAETGPSGDRRLVAYVVPAGAYADGDLRAHAAAALPGYMVPSAFVRCAELPLGATGKLDAAALHADWRPLTAAQRRLWLADQVDAGLAYLLPVLVRLRGEVDADALRAALGDLVDRHETLRTVFALRDQEPRLSVRPPGTVRPGFAVRPLAGLPAAEGEHGFDLTTEIPLRAVLFRDDPRESVLLLMFHHIAVDGSALVPLLADLSRAYAARAAGAAPEFPAPPLSYQASADALAARLGERSDPDSPRSRQLAYWRATLAGLPDRTRLPRRPATRVPGRRARAIVRRLDADAHGRLLRLARAHRATPFMVLHAALAILLHRAGAGTDIAIGVPVAGPDAGEVVGFAVNLLVLRTDLGGAPRLDELLRRVRATDLAAFAHRDLPFDEVVAALDPVRRAGRHPLVDVVLAVQNTVPPAFTLPGGDATVEIGRPVAARFELLVDVTEEHDAAGGPAGAVVTVEHQDEVFDPALPEWLAGALPTLLAAMAGTPDAPIASLAAPPPPRPGGGEPAPPEPDRPPRAGIEARLAAIWSAALGTDGIGAHDNFFAVGGTSLDAVRVAARISATEQAPVTAAEIFARPTIAELAGAIGGPVSRIPRAGRGAAPCG